MTTLYSSDLEEIAGFLQALNNAVESSGDIYLSLGDILVKDASRNDVTLGVITEQDEGTILVFNPL